MLTRLLLLITAATLLQVGSVAISATNIEPQQYSGVKKMGCYNYDCIQCGEQIRYCAECTYCRFFLGTIVTCWEQWECSSCYYAQGC